MEKTIYSKEYLTFLKHLRRAREDAGITQVEMADRIKETQSFVSRCERGERRIDVIELESLLPGNRRSICRVYRPIGGSDKGGGLTSNLAHLQPTPKDKSQAF